MAGLSTHILDTAAGCPASGIHIQLRQVDDNNRLIGSWKSNDDGRVDSPLLDSSADAGVYELSFHAGDYFRERGHTLAEPAFLDIVVIRFGFADPNAHYHVPLLISPYSYSTYRGS